MSKAAQYSAVEPLRDGSQIEIRAFAPEDRPALIAAVGEVGPRSRYLRFFTLKREFSEREREFFLNIDFDRHVALVAVAEEAGQKHLVGAGRYVGVEPGKAEVAFTVIDRCQGQGIGKALVRHHVIVAREAGLHELFAEVLPENTAMRKVFSKFGFQARRGPDPQVVHLVLEL